MTMCETCNVRLLQVGANEFLCDSIESAALEKQYYSLSNVLSSIMFRND